VNLTALVLTNWTTEERRGFGELNKRNIGVVIGALQFCAEVIAGNGCIVVAFKDL
jgi:hypothetical protein